MRLGPRQSTGGRVTIYEIYRSRSGWVASILRRGQSVKLSFRTMTMITVNGAVLKPFSFDRFSPNCFPGKRLSAWSLTRNKCGHTFRIYKVDIFNYK